MNSITRTRERAEGKRRKEEGGAKEEKEKEEEEEEEKGTYKSTGCSSQIHLEPIIFIRLYCAIS
jgi:hypothetical protein